MVSKVESRAQEFSFSEEEFAAATTLTFLNECFLRDQLSRTMQDRAKVPVEPSNPLEHVLTLEFMRGQITILEHLLELHERSKDN